MTAPLFPRQALYLLTFTSLETSFSLSFHFPPPLLSLLLSLSISSLILHAGICSPSHFSPQFSVFLLRALSLSESLGHTFRRSRMESVACLSKQRIFQWGGIWDVRTLGVPRHIQVTPPQRRGQRKEDYEMEAPGAEGPGLRRTGGLGAGRAAQGRGAVSRIPRPW